MVEAIQSSGVSSTVPQVPQFPQSLPSDLKHQDFYLIFSPLL
jgi:hypothetical protein